MLKSGKSVKSLWLGGERFDKYSQDDEDALAKYKKMKAFIGTQVYVQKDVSIKDLEISIRDEVKITDILNVVPQNDGNVTVTNIMWDGDHSVDLIGSVAVYYVLDDNISQWDEEHTDLCIIDTESI